MDHLKRDLHEPFIVARLRHVIRYLGREVGYSSLKR